MGTGPWKFTLNHKFIPKTAKKSKSRDDKQVKSDKRSCNGNNEEYDACDDNNNFSWKNFKCKPEDNEMYSDQDFEELGRAERKIMKRKRKAREKKHNKEGSDKEYDRLVHKVWKKNEIEKKNKS